MRLNYLLKKLPYRKNARKKSGRHQLDWSCTHPLCRFRVRMYPGLIFDHVYCISFYRLVVEIMFRHSLHTLRSTPQRLFSALKHTGNPKRASKTALTTRSVNDAYDKPFPGALSGNIGSTSIVSSKSTPLLLSLTYYVTSLLFSEFDLSLYFYSLRCRSYCFWKGMFSI